MCRNIRTLANFTPPATTAEIRASDRLIHGWVTGAPPKDRDVEIREMIERS